MSNLFVTSIIYPFLVQDAMAVAMAALERGNLLTVTVDPAQVPVPTLQSGTLAPTIAFLTYDGRPFPDTGQVFLPTLQSGTLVVTISYLSYGPTIDPAQVPVPTLQSGTLIVTINYIIYTNSLAHPDTAQVPVPTLRSGTLV